MLSLLAKYLPKVLPILGAFQKGRATKAGDVISAAGVVVASLPHAGALFGVVTDANLIGSLHEVGFIIGAVGQLVASFGLGRKAADARANIAQVPADAQ